MNIDFDKLKYSLTGEYEEVVLEKQLEEYKKSDYILNGIFEYLDVRQDECIKRLDTKFGTYVDVIVKDFINEIKEKAMKLSEEYDKENNNNEESNIEQ